MKINDYLLFFLKFVAGFFVFYLIGCFINVSFSLKAWTEDSRILIAIFGSIAGIVIGFIKVINDIDVPPRS